MQALENHHPDKKNKPDFTIPISHKEHQKIHNTTPIMTYLSKRIREYTMLCRMTITMKQWLIAYKKDFDKTPDIGLKKIESLKNKMVREFKKLSLEYKEFSGFNIRGIGAITLMTILAYAHPNRFPSLRKFLFYCGYKQSSRVLKHYNRKIKPAMYNSVLCVIKYKDEKFYPLYLKLKDEISKQFPNKSKYTQNKMAMNRTATFILKEIYDKFKDMECR